jgi:hypothetical protein
MYRKGDDSRADGGVIDWPQLAQNCVEPLTVLMLRQQWCPVRALIPWMLERLL